jgi:hypothetical protein
MAESCALHPDGVTCELRTRNHPLCTGQRLPGDYVDWINIDHKAPRTESKAKTTDKLSELAGKVSRPARAGEAPLEGFAAGLEGSEHAAARWDDHQKALVDDAIVIVAAKHSGGGTFTSDDVWAKLNGAVPVTKGLTARLMAAEREGTIENTSETTISDRGGEHDHGQRLTVWRSLA